SPILTRSVLSFPTRRSSDLTDGGIMSEGLFALITAAIILASYRFAERRSILDATLLGTTIALAMLTRPEAVSLLVVLAIPLVLRSEEHTSELQSLAYLVCRL